MLHEAIVELVLAFTVTTMVLGALAAVLMPFALLLRNLAFELLDFTQVIILISQLRQLLLLIIVELLLNSHALPQQFTFVLGLVDQVAVLLWVFFDLTLDATDRLYDFGPLPLLLHYGSLQFF